jgi:hypothetical protein
VPKPPSPARIFHITAIDNLGSIAGTGALLAKSELTKRGANFQSIAYADLQDRRARKTVPVTPGGTLHDYVPFHFAPRSPMLLTINSGHVPNCTYRQADIAHLVGTVEDVVAAKVPFAFTNYHAILDFADFYNDVNRLDQIDWPLFFEKPLRGGYCPYWNSDSSNPLRVRRRETRQAEFLIYQTCPLAFVKEIAVFNDAAAERTRKIFADAGMDIPVTVNAQWYY